MVLGVIMSVNMLVAGSEPRIAVGIAMGYVLDGRGSIPSRGKIFFPTPQHPDWLWAHPASSEYLGVRQPGSEADHSPPSSTEAKNGGAIHPLPCMSSWCGA
jgi:hypothetical protein